MKLFLRTFLVLVLFLAPAINAKTLKVISRQSEIDVAQAYYFDLLQAALERASIEAFELKTVDASGLSQGRMLQLLENGFIDVYWTGTTLARERRFLAIRVPLMKGLLGYRVSIIRKDVVGDFTAMSIDSLKQRVACQGEHWPDTKILEHNDYAVAPVALYKRMFEMVSLGRCDYFPRAIFEAYGELEQAQRKSPNLSVYDDTILYYPFPIYFFVRADQEALASVIEEGLKAMIASGEFDTYMMSHPLTKNLYPLKQWTDKRIVTLENPFLPSDTPIGDSSLFLKL